MRSDDKVARDIPTRLLPIVKLLEKLSESHREQVKTLAVSLRAGEIRLAGRRDAEEGALGGTEEEPPHGGDSGPGRWFVDGPSRPATGVPGPWRHTGGRARRSARPSQEP